ncbi:MAG: hypothetical protein O7G83_03010 [Proteobacteria bacterium]|nr:hypothetical protein [Pseudomonadota bacterium]
MGGGAGFFDWDRDPDPVVRDSCLAPRVEFGMTGDRQRADEDIGACLGQAGLIPRSGSAWPHG